MNKAVELHQLRELLKELVELFQWSDASPLHAALHVGNAVNNLRADLAVEQHRVQRLEAEVARLSQGDGWIEGTWENWFPVLPPPQYAWFALEYEWGFETWPVVPDTGSTTLIYAEAKSRSRQGLSGLPRWFWKPMPGPGPLPTESV